MIQDNTTKHKKYELILNSVHTRFYKGSHIPHQGEYTMNTVFLIFPFFTFFQQLDRYDGSGPAVSPNALPYGADGYDVVDSTPDPQRTKQAIAQLQQKILKLTEQIKIEQTARDDNVAEYLKLANNADKQQSARIKQVFEKKNQKSAQTIQQLQRKLEHYHRKLREVEHNGIPRQPKDVFRDMHQGLKDVGAKVRVFLNSVNLFS